MTRFTQPGHNLTIPPPKKKSGKEQMAIALGKRKPVLVNSPDMNIPPDNTNGMHTSGAILYRHL